MKQLTLDKKKAKLLGFITLLVVICLVVIAWLFFSAKHAAEMASKKDGMNLQLPGADVKKDSAKDKQSFYSQAEIDAAKRVEAIRMDPNRRDTAGKMPERIVDKTTTVNSGSIRPKKTSTDYDQLEARLRSIQSQLSVSTANEYANDGSKHIPNQYQQPEKIVQVPPDPEMEAINTTLDKIMAIQHPAKQVLAEPNSHVVAVQAIDKDGDGYFGTKDTSVQKKFLGDEKSMQQSASSFAAFIPETQILQSGSVVKLQLQQSLVIAGHTLGSGSLLFGIAALENERLLVRIPSVRAGNDVLSVALSVYDMDGLEGIYVPGSLSDETVKSTADQALQSLNIVSLEPSMATQAAMAGIGAVKNLVRKKVKAVRVTVIAGYRVWLRDNKGY